MEENVDVEGRSGAPEDAMTSTVGRGGKLMVEAMVLNVFDDAV
jgi:hypothetical protein